MCHSVTAFHIITGSALISLRTIMVRLLWIINDSRLWNKWCWCILTLEMFSRSTTHKVRNHHPDVIPTVCQSYHIIWEQECNHRIHLPVQGVCLLWLIASSNKPCSEQRIIVDNNKATEEERNITFVQIIEYAVCNEHFIHRHFHKLVFRLLWSECTGDMISRIAYRLW